MPPGTSATISVPAPAAGRDTGGGPARFEPCAGGYAVYAATAGHDTFHVRLTG